jgi:hypothetical protein
MSRKGGNSVFSTLCPEVADHVTEGVIAVAGLLDDVLQRTSLDEIGAERLIAAVERVGRFEEEA